MDAPTLLVVAHDVDPDAIATQAGTLTTWAGERGVRMRPVVAGPALPEPDEVPRLDAVAVLGSREGAWDDTVPWLADEIAFLRTVVAADVPILGICFGGQILARVLGGTAARGTTPETGWRTITTETPDEIPAGPWMEFHFDVFTTPPDARRLATSDVCDQAFRAGPHLGVQFHPEITQASFETWAGRWAGTWFERDVMPTLGISTEGLRAEVAERAEASRAASRVLFDGFAARAGLGARILTG